MKNEMKSSPRMREAFGSWERVLELLPLKIRREILHIGASRKDFPIGMSEIRLRAVGRCSVLISGDSIPLLSTLSEGELEDITLSVADGSVFAYRDTVAEGYIPLSGGIRVGVCGRARYDGGELVGINGVGSLVFRLPFAECGFAERLTELFLGGCRSGMLVYAPPGGGKTTALRDLARLIGSGALAKRVCVVDERCEFLPEDYIGCEVDLLRGYKRSAGIEIAARTLTPEVIIIDEIGAEDAEGLRSVIRCGIPIVATAHASGIEEIFEKPALRALIDDGAFDLFVGIVRAGREYGFVATTLPEAGGGR